MISRPPRRVAEACPFGSSLRSPHHSFGTVPPLPCRGWHVPQGHASATAVSQKSSGRLSRRSRTLPAFLLLLAVACSRPSSYEQFVRAEDAADGVYEFTLPIMAAEASAETSVSSGSGTSDVTYDLSFYTSPLDEPLQLAVTWLYSPGEELRSTYGPGDILLTETVWFPAGQHRALYRSGIRFSADLSGNTPKSLQVPPKNPLPVENIAEISTGTPKNTPTCIENGEKLYRSAVTIQVTPINPPEDFRGLGIICKKNDGTR